MSYGRDNYRGGGGEGYGGGGYDGGGRGGEGAGYYDRNQRFDDEPPQDDRHGARQEQESGGYGGGGPRRDDDYGRPGGGQGYGGRSDDYGRTGGGFGGGRQDDSGRPSGGIGGYGGGRDDDYGRTSGSHGTYGGSGQTAYPGGPPTTNESGSGYASHSKPGHGSSQPTGRYGEVGGGYSGPQSGVESTPYDAPTSGYDGQYRPAGGHGGSGGSHGLDDDEVLNHTDKDDDKGLFSTALSFLKGSKDEDEDIDESKMQRHHDNIYQGNASNNQDANSLGAGAAIHAFQMFTGGGRQDKSSSGGQSKFIGMALSEASKLFDQQSSQGKVQSGTDKQSVINAAGKQALKLYLKNQGGGGGGSGGIMGLASKFLK